MPEVLRITSVQRRLYEPDLIPLPQLLAPSESERFRSEFKFPPELRQHEPPGPLTLIYGPGEFSSDGAPAMVEQLLVQPNSVQFQIEGPTGVADAFFSRLAEVLSGLGQMRLGEVPPYVKTAQSIVVARLKLDAQSLLAPGLQDAVSEVLLPEVERGGAKASLRPEHLSWQVLLKSPSPEYVFAPRQVTIEPRSGSKPEDRIFYTESPLDSDAHIALLARIERLMAENGSGDARRKRRGRSRP